jgi:hypothetical protein
MGGHLDSGRRHDVADQAGGGFSLVLPDLSAGKYLSIEIREFDRVAICKQKALETRACGQDGDDTT